MQDRQIILGVSGGIAAYKAADLASKLTQSGAVVSVVMTESAQEFVGPVTFEALTNRPVNDDLFTPDRTLSGRTYRLGTFGRVAGDCSGHGKLPCQTCSWFGRRSASRHWP